MTSLKTRLSWGLTLSLIFLLTLQWAIVSFAIYSFTHQQLSERLQREGESLLAGIDFDAQGQLTLDANRMSAVYQRVFSGHYYLVISDDQRLASRSLWDSSLNVSSLRPDEEKEYATKGPDGQSLMLVSNGYRKQNRNLTITIAEDISALQSNLMQFQLIYALVSIAGLLTLLAIQRWIVAKALSPLQEIQQNMIRLSRGEAQTIEVQGPLEITPLIAELNRLLLTMREKSRRSRESLGNLAHALKTKLTLLNQIAEREALNSELEIRSEIYKVSDAIRQHLDRELKRARLMGDSQPMRKVNLKNALAQLTHTLRQIYADKEVNIIWKIGKDTEFYGDQEDLLEMLGNLLDNACKWCSKTVHLDVRDVSDENGGHAPCFVIEDDGPGCEQSTLYQLTQRGFKADESKPGSGLGLAIVYDIVNSYGANLSFGKSATLGGLSVKVQFAPRTMHTTGVQ